MINNENVLRTRLLICESCQNKCNFYQTTAIEEECFVCPLKEFNKFGCKEMGLGDAVEIVVKPIARVVDRITSILPEKLQTDIANCGSCKKRKEFLNSI